MKPHYCFFDTETTGLEFNSEIISIAMVFTDKDFNVLNTFSRHFHPQNGISDFVAKINGFNSTLWSHRQANEGFTNLHDEWISVFEKLSNCEILIAQNNSFDLCRLLSTVYDHRYLCELWRKMPRTLDLASFAKHFMDNQMLLNNKPVRDYYSLKYIAKECEVSYKNAHDAMVDALITLNCWVHIQDYYNREN